MAFTISYVYKATDNFSPTTKKISDQLEILNKHLREVTLNLRRVTAGFRAARVAGTQFGNQLTTLNGQLQASNNRLRRMDRAIVDMNRQASNAATQGLRQMDAALNRIRANPPLPMGGAVGAGRGRGGGGGRRERIGGDLAGSGAAISAAVTLPAILMGKAMFKAAADVESLEVSFTNTLRSADKAGKLMTELKKFSKESIFNLPELGQTARLLIATGIGLEDLMPAMRDIGDVAAGTGKPIAGLGLAFGQVKAKGRLMGEEVLQFAERGIPLLPLLAKKFDVTVLQMNKAISNGEVSFKRFREAWSDLVKEGGIFAGQAQAQAKALGGAFKVFQSSVLLASAKAGMAINDLFDIVDKLGVSGQIVEFLGDAFVRLAEDSPDFTRFSVVTLLAVAALGAFAIVLGAILLVVSPIALAIIGLASLWVGAIDHIAANWDRMLGNIVNGLKGIGAAIIENNPLQFLLIGMENTLNSLPDWAKKLLFIGDGGVSFRFQVPEALQTRGAKEAQKSLSERLANTRRGAGGVSTLDRDLAGTNAFQMTTNKLIDSMDQWREEDRAIQLKITLDQDGRVEGASATGDVGVNMQ